MAITVKIDPIERDISLMVDELLSPEAQSAALADYARTALGEVEAANAAALGFVPPYETYVDGRRGAALESVQPRGTIVFEFELLNDLFAWIGEQLVTHSPVLTGRYARSHLFFADGVELDPGAPLPAASEYVFLSPLPYARKIERGQSDQAPDGVYQAVAALAARRFGNIAQIKFSYRTPIEGAPPPAASIREARRRERDARRPAIVITVN